MTLMHKIYNFALNPTHTQQAHYFRHILHAEEITGRPEGGGHRSMSTPINTPLDVGLQQVQRKPLINSQAIFTLQKYEYLT